MALQQQPITADKTDFNDGILDVENVLVTSVP